jgi:hypothetical protein
VPDVARRPPGLNEVRWRPEEQKNVREGEYGKLSIIRHAPFYILSYLCRVEKAFIF